MSCPACGSETLSFPIPEAYAEILPDARRGAAICQRCLSMRPVDEPPTELPDFTTLSTALPSEPERALPVVLILGLVDQIALYRSELDGLTEVAERKGVDVLLVLDRLEDDPNIDPAFDLSRRRTQLGQFLG